MYHVQVRKDGTCPWLRPDGKTQVTVEYFNDKGAMVPQRVHTILISTQHSPDVDNEYIHKELLEHVIKPVVPAKYMDDQTIFHLNPSGAVANILRAGGPCISLQSQLPPPVQSAAAMFLDFGQSEYLRLQAQLAADYLFCVCLFTSVCMRQPNAKCCRALRDRRATR